METIAWIRSVLSGTAVERRLSSLDELYAEAGRKMSRWRETTALTCREGCGICCEGFIPDVLGVEAELIACFLLAERPDLIERLKLESQHCLFYRKHTRGGCTIYPVRPLVCRLFGFSSVRNSAGERIFRLCRYMEDRGARSFTDIESLAVFGTVPPSMQDFSYRLIGLGGGSASERLPIEEAVEERLIKIRFLLWMLDPESTPPQRPTPARLPA